MTPICSLCGTKSGSSELGLNWQTCWNPLYLGVGLKLQAMKTIQLFIVSILLGGLWLPGLSLRADQMIPLPIDRLTAKAQLILQGKVLSTTVQRDAQGRIYTAVTLQVDEVWKGSLRTSRFTLVHGGGILGDHVATVSGETDYQVGEEVVAFLVLNQRGEGVSVGLSQGKFHIWKDPSRGEKLAYNRFHGLHPSAANPLANGAPAAAVLNRLTLADLKQRVQGGAK